MFSSDFGAPAALHPVPCRGNGTPVHTLMPLLARIVAIGVRSASDAIAPAPGAARSRKPSERRHQCRYKDEKKRNERKSSKPDSNDAMHVMSLVSSLAVERDSVLRALRREEETSRRLRKEMREREASQAEARKILKEATDFNIAQLEQDVGAKLKGLCAEVLREQLLLQQREASHRQSAGSRSKAQRASDSAGPIRAPSSKSCCRRPKMPLMVWWKSSNRWDQKRQRTKPKHQHLRAVRAAQREATRRRAMMAAGS